MSFFSPFFSPVEVPNKNIQVESFLCGNGLFEERNRLCQARLKFLARGGVGPNRNSLPGTRKQNKKYSISC